MTELCPAGTGVPCTLALTVVTRLCFSQAGGPSPCLRLSRPPLEPGHDSRRKRAGHPLSWEPPAEGSLLPAGGEHNEPRAPGRAGRGVGAEARHRCRRRLLSLPSSGGRGLSPGGPDHVPGSSSPLAAPRPGVQHTGLSHSRATGTGTRAHASHSYSSSHSHPHAHAHP